MDFSNRRILSGVVITDSADKTINVLVQTYKSHPLYKKRYKYSKKYLAHDPEGKAHIGDKVDIIETRPLSRHKHFRLLKITEKRNS